MLVIFRSVTCYLFDTKVHDFYFNAYYDIFLYLKLGNWSSQMWLWFFHDILWSTIWFSDLVCVSVFTGISTLWSLRVATFRVCCMYIIPMLIEIPESSDYWHVVWCDYLKSNIGYWVAHTDWIQPEGIMCVCSYPMVYSRAALSGGYSFIFHWGCADPQ